MITSAPPVTIEYIARYRKFATMGPVLKSANVTAIGFALDLVTLFGSFRTDSLYRSNDEDPDVVERSDEAVPRHATARHGLSLC